MLRDQMMKKERKKAKREYEARSRLLAELGFDSYQKYLASERWLCIRRRVFAKRGKRCYGCGGRAIQVHHGNYSHGVLTGKTLDMLYPVCRKCHKAIEFIDGAKVAPSTATKKLYDMRLKRLSKPRERYPRAAVDLLCVALDRLGESMSAESGDTPIEAITEELAAVFQARRGLEPTVGDVVSFFGGRVVEVLRRR